MPKEGKLYANRFELQKLLGNGGTGEVWLARDSELEIDVALKFLKPSFSDEDTEVLKRETRQARSLSHRHILPVYDFVRPTDDRAAISMEYAPNGSVGDLVPKLRPFLEVREISDWMLQACEALAYIHDECEIAHRDVKPGNMMLDADKRLKLADFGLSYTIATHLDDETKETIGTRLTMPFASPQNVWNPYESDPINDIYSLGVSIFFLLTGKYPFKDPRKNTWRWDPNNLLAMSDIRNAMSYPGEPIPETWDYAVAKCLAEDPSDRPGSAQDLGELLGSNERTLSRRTSYGSGIAVAAAENSDKPSNKPVENSNAAFILISAAILGLIGGLVWGTLAILSHQEEANRSSEPERISPPAPLTPPVDSTL